MVVTAQISVYPLRQLHLEPAVQTVRAELDARKLRVDTGPMSTVTVGEADTVFAALHAAFTHAAAAGEVAMVVTLSNACPT